MAELLAAEDFYRVNLTMTPQGVEQSARVSRWSCSVVVNLTMTPQGVEQSSAAGIVQPQPGGEPDDDAARR